MKHPGLPPSRIYKTFKKLVNLAAARSLFRCQAFCDKSLRLYKNYNFYKPFESVTFGMEILLTLSLLHNVI